MTLKKTLAAALVAITTAGAAVAADALSSDDALSSNEVDRFVTSLEDVEAFGEAVRERGDGDVISQPTNPFEGGAFSPYGASITALRGAAPKVYADFAKTLKPHGFAPAEWASVGDRVFAAYMAIELAENPDYAQMRDMDPAMLDMMPPAARAQFDGMMKALEKLKDVPEADLAAVRPSVAALEAHMEADR